MPPKPFPYPFNIGIDIACAKRFEKYAENERAFNQFARKVFTSLEWPTLRSRQHSHFLQARQNAISGAEGSKGGLGTSSSSSLGHRATSGRMAHFLAGR